MNHTDRELLIELCLDGESEDNEQAEVFTHLALCPDCRAYARVILAVRQTALQEQVSFPASIDGAIPGIVPATIVNVMTGSRQWWRIPAPVAAAALLVVAAISMMTGQYLGAKHESTRWEREMGVHYQLPTVVVIGYLDDHPANKQESH